MERKGSGVQNPLEAEAPRCHDCDRPVVARLSSTSSWTPRPCCQSPLSQPPFLGDCVSSARRALSRCLWCPGIPDCTLTGTFMGCDVWLRKLSPLPK